MQYDKLIEPLFGKIEDIDPILLAKLDFLVKGVAQKCADLIDDGNGELSSMAENVWCNICRDVILKEFNIYIRV